MPVLAVISLNTFFEIFGFHDSEGSSQVFWAVTPCITIL